MIRAVTPLIALIALFVFPWQVALAGIFVASIMVPPAGLALGLIGELVYYSPGGAFMPYFLAFGAFSSGIALLVHRFVKTRIMEG